MKDTKFFIEKSKTLIIDLKESEIERFESFFDKNDTTSMFEVKKNNRNKIGELEFQIKLMFSEFDNGQLFLQKIESFDNRMRFNDEPKRAFLVDTLKTFIAYLEEYRIKPIRVDIN